MVLPKVLLDQLVAGQVEIPGTPAVGPSSRSWRHAGRRMRRRWTMVPFSVSAVSRVILCGAWRSSTLVATTSSP